MLCRSPASAVPRFSTSSPPDPGDGQQTYQLCDTLLAELGGAFDDDVAQRAVRAHPEDRPRPPEAGPSVEPADLRGR
ncbi:hypothetical protein [Geodermatophilus sp. URMC 60]